MPALSIREALFFETGLRRPRPGAQCVSSPECPSSRRDRRLRKDPAAHAGTLKKLPCSYQKPDASPGATRASSWLHVRASAGAGGDSGGGGHGGAGGEDCGSEHSSSKDDSHQIPLTSRIRNALNDLLHLRFLEIEGRQPLPPPRTPSLRYNPGQLSSPRSILEADKQSLRQWWQVFQWWIGEWQVPLPNEYDADQVANYFLRRPHLLLLRMLQVSVFFTGTWALIVADTIAIRRAEADGIPSDSPQISIIRMRSAARLKQALLLLGPTFVKVAQSISTRPDIVGPETATVLAELQDRLPPFPTEEALLVIKEELHLHSAAEAFAVLGPEPVASASLGQVYKGMTTDGRQVAVKIQRPGVLEKVARDICILRLLLRLLRRVARINSDVGLLADELGRGLFGELDYRQEAANAEAFAAAHAHMQDVVVPGIIHPLTSRRVLTMDWIEGERTSDLLAQMQSSSSPSDAPGAMSQNAGFGYGPGQRGPGRPGTGEGGANGMPMPGGLGTGLGAEFGRPGDLGGAFEVREAARAKLLTMVGIGVESSLEQLLGTGLLHADPHPGNLLYTSGGKLAYLDFGLLCRMEPQHQAAMLAAIAHLVNGEWKLLTEDFAAMDVLKPNMDKNAVTMALQEAFSSSVASSISGSGDATPLQFGQISISLWKMALRFRFRLPPYYTLVLRSLASLEGIAIAVDPQFRVFACAYPYVVRRLLTDRSPSSQQVLRNLVLTPEGRLRWDRFSEFASSSNLASREEAMRQAAPSLHQQQSASYEKKTAHGPMGRQTANGNSEWNTQTTAEQWDGRGFSKLGGNSKAASLLLLDLLLSEEAATTRRMLLNSDVQYLAEAFLSDEAAPVRTRLIVALSDLIYTPWVGRHEVAPSSSAFAHSFVKDTPQRDSTRLLPPALDALASSLETGGETGGETRGASPPRSDGGSISAMSVEESAEFVSGPSGPYSGSSSGSYKGSQGKRETSSPQFADSGASRRRDEMKGRVKGQLSLSLSLIGLIKDKDTRLKRLWVLLRSAFLHMKGGPILKVKLVWTALVMIISALLGALRNLFVDSYLQLLKALHSGEVQDSDGFGTSPAAP